MKFNLRIDDMEARSSPFDSVEIIKWVKDKGIDIAFVLARWNQSDLEFVRDRPFNLNVAERDIFWKLAMYGQSLLKQSEE